MKQGQPLEIALQQVEFFSGADGRSMRIDVRDKSGSEVRLHLDASTAPSFATTVLMGAVGTMKHLDEAELVELTMQDTSKNLLNPLPAYGAKAVSGDEQTQLIISLGPISLQFRLPKEAAESCAREILKN